MKERKSKHHIDGLAGILTFVIFAGCILSVLLSGAGVYKRLTARDGSAFERRSCAQYVAMKLRQTSSADCVSLLPFGEGDALCISESIGDKEYVTYVYCSDGWLRELFASGDQSFSPEAGEKLLETADMRLAMDKGLVTVCFTDLDGGESSISIALRGGEGAA